MSEPLWELAAELNAAEHHSRCDSRRGKACDCFQRDRASYRLARGYAELKEERDRLREERDEALAALKDEMKWDMGGVPENEWKRRAEAAEEKVERYEEIERAARELAGYVRAHLAGQDADPELRWALDKADAALAASAPPPDGRNIIPAEIRADALAMVAEMHDPETKPCGCGYPVKPCLRVMLRNGPPFPARPCEPAPPPERETS